MNQITIEVGDHVYYTKPWKVNDNTLYPGVVARVDKDSYLIVPYNNKRAIKISKILCTKIID